MNARLASIVPFASLVLGACVIATTSLPLPEIQSGQALYVIDSSHTFPHFAVSHLSLSTQRGRFNKSSGWIVLDRAARSGSMELIIDAASVDTGDPVLEARLREADFFDVERFPSIVYRANRLRFDGDTLVGVDGELTLRGVTRPVPLRVTSFHCAPLPLIRIEACGASAEGRINRIDFGITLYPSLIGTEIALLIQVEAHRR